MKYIILILLSTIALGAPEDDAKKTAKSFISSIFDKNLSRYKENVSPSFYQQQSDNGFIDDHFKSKKKVKPIGEYDLILKKGAVDKIFFANFKEKSQKEYGDNWFILSLNKEGNFIVNGVHHFED